MRVSLAQPHRLERFAAAAQPRPLLMPCGAEIVLGGVAEDVLAEPVRSAAHTLFGPRGAALTSPVGPLFVCDTGHHRLLGWRHAPHADATPADFVFGQPDFFGEARNAGGGVGPATLNVPTGVAIANDVLAVADAWNHRVLLWHGLPANANRAPDVVLGQADFTGGLANRGAAIPSAASLNWCYGVAISDGKLIVVDTGNRRVLVWNGIPQESGAPADLVLGQSDFSTRDDGGGMPPGAVGMRWPHAVVIAAGQLFVADAGASRIMVWRRLPDVNGAPCDAVLGQDRFDAIDHNRGAYDPTAATLNMPYGLAALRGRLVIADTANSRLLGVDLGEIETGAAADRLAGQCWFHEKGENRWRSPSRDSLCWPYGISARGDTAIIADSGNNRVLLWRAA